jgi:hypothetical protein
MVYEEKGNLNIHYVMEGMATGNISSGTMNSDFELIGYEK